MFALDKTKLIVKASEKLLGVSKSSVSQHIASLERNNGTELSDG